MASWILILALAQTADVATSCAAFARGFVEANPMLPTSCPGLVAIKGSLTVGYAFGTRPLFRSHPRVMKWVTIGVAGVPLSAALLNIHRLSHRR